MLTNTVLVRVAFCTLLLAISTNTTHAQSCGPDPNFDGVVNIQDFSIIGSCFGRDLTIFPRCEVADLDRNDQVDRDDILLLQPYFGETIEIELDGDGNHDGIIDANGEDDNFENNLPGIIVLANVDDDDGDGNKDGMAIEAATIDDVAGVTNRDSDDLAKIVINRVPFLSSGTVLHLTLHTPSNIASEIEAGNIVRVFSGVGPSAIPILGHEAGSMPTTTTFILPEISTHGVDLDTLRREDIILGVEGLEFAAEVKLSLGLVHAGSGYSCSDIVQLKVAPLILIGHHQDPIRSFVAHVSDVYSNPNGDFVFDYFPNATPIEDDHVIPPELNWNYDRWAQDEFQIGFQQAPYKSIYVVLDSIRDRGLREFPPRSSSLDPPGLLGPDFGHIQVGVKPANSLDGFGNLEITPPLTVAGRWYPFGRIYYGGSSGDVWGFNARDMNIGLRDFLVRQKIQAPVELYSSWLDVGHVDEFMSIVPDSSGTHGWKVILADPLLAIDTLMSVAANLHIPRYTHYNRGSYVVNTTSQLLLLPLAAPGPGGSHDITDFNMNEIAPIIFGSSTQVGLKERIMDFFALTEDDFLHVPVLFDFYAACIPFDGIICWGGAEAITPDLANGSVYQGVYIAPDNFLHVFDSSITEEDINGNLLLDPGEDINMNGKLDTFHDPFHIALSATLPPNMNAVFIDDWSTYHIFGGEIHCSANEQRTLPPETWWSYE